MIEPGVDWQKCFLEYSVDQWSRQGARHIIRRNDIGKYLLDNFGAGPYRTHVPNMRRALQDSDIESMVNGLPDDLAEPARKEELIRVLRWRRDNLLSLLRGL